MIIVRIWEGLGNQMFQYAYARALAEKGIDVRLDLDKAYDNKFEKYRNHTVRENSIQNFRISIPSINVYEYGKYDYLDQNTVTRNVIFWLGRHFMWKYNFYEESAPEFSSRKMMIRGNCYIKGWFQNEKYFNNIRSELLKEFVPRNKIKIGKEIKRALEDDESVAVHIRRGDYVRIKHDLSVAYYMKAMDYIKKAYKNPIFLVFSDDLQWVKQNMNIEGRLIYVNENGKLRDFEELFIMSRCKSNIISNSTFSWWAAWLNQNNKKIIVSPKNEWAMRIVPESWVCL